MNASGVTAGKLVVYFFCFTILYIFVSFLNIEYVIDVVGAVFIINTLSLSISVALFFSIVIFISLYLNKIIQCV